MLQPDLGAEAVRRSLEASLGDRSIPLDERIGHLLVMAGTDQAIHQHEAALTKYEIIRDHHIATGNAALAAVALNGMGEALEKLGQLGLAGEHWASTRWSWRDRAITLQSRYCSTQS